MILIGQYDSPFVRRVAIAMWLYNIEFKHQPWSVFGDADQLAVINPLRRVPTLVIEDGEALVESSAILDYLDELAGEDDVLIARFGQERRRTLRVCAFATGLADKAVSLVYERVVHERGTPAWIERCRAQIGGVLDLLEREHPGAGWFFQRFTHADIAVACVLRFVREAHPGVFDAERWPALAAHCDACEEMPVFKEISQAFHVTPPKG